MERLAPQWGSIYTYFIFHLPRTNQRFDVITAWVDILLGRDHLFPCRADYAAVKAV